MEKEKETTEKELSLALTQFLKILYIDFGITNYTKKITNWYKLSWEEFKNELEQEDVKFNPCLLEDWQNFFQHHKKKVLSLMDKVGSETVKV